MSDKNNNIYEDLYIQQVLKKESSIIQSDIFVNLCEGKISYEQPTEVIVQHENFIQMIDKLNNSHPFLYVPEFLEDHVSGIYNRDILKKFQLSDHDKFSKCLSKNYLDLPKRRNKGYSFSRKKNLETSSYYKRFNQINDEIDFFQEELLEVLHYNTVRAIILLILIESDKSLSNERIFSHIEETFQKNKDSFQNFNHNKEIMDSFENYLKNITLEKIDSVLTELTGGFINKTYDNEFELIVTFPEIRKYIIHILEKKNNSFSSLLNKIINEFPVVRFIPFFYFFEKMLNELIENGIVRNEMAQQFYHPFSDILYLVGNYELSKKPIASIDKGKKPFFGRKNEDSFDFIYQLERLPKGDLDDTDDQVTRIAGLILAESLLLKSPHEELREFDFAIDMTNYELREEQKEAMKKSQFVMRAKKIHVKVMINDDVPEELIKQLQKVLPKNEQGVIISFKKISEKVKNILPNDYSIQIIDKKGIQIWSDISPVLPSRIGSIVRIMSGELIGNIAILKQVNYETGNAIINLFPSQEEVNMYIGFLEEINLWEDPQVDDHLLFSKNYYEFLNMVSKITNENSVKNSIFKYPIIQNDIILMEIMNENYVKSRFGHELLGWSLDVEGKDVKIHLYQKKFEDTFECSCDDWKEKKELCIHLISALNEIGLRNSFFSDSWGDEEQNIFYKTLKNIA